MSGQDLKATMFVSAIQAIAEDQNGELLVALQKSPRPLRAVSKPLNDLRPATEASVDYIHGSSTAMALASPP